MGSGGDNNIGVNMIRVERLIRAGCPLCDMQRLTKWYEVTETYIICNCKSCGTPMLVWRDHDPPSEGQREQLLRIARMKYPGMEIDEEQRTIKDHYHFHIGRKK
ncbi:hypothetical protein LCGC14_0235530 [marine sediment metagenome]|uniref:Uncharacterized protein n=1 Tax=marine sediment metagenome TaxID=412755 RepID=A0A0F9UQA1_9ZZZZ